MRAKPISPDEQLHFVMQCRSSGLSDYQWCQMNGIKSGTFYNWVSRLRKSGATVPSSALKTETRNVVEHSVIKMDLLPEPDAFPFLPKQENGNERKTTVEIRIGQASIRFFDSTDSRMLETTLKCLGGAFYAG